MSPALFQSLHRREFDPIEIEAAVIDVGHREDMSTGLQRERQMA